jgi:NADPH:quinone reductase-like Zn-dependent oxidoreductase
MRALRCNEYGSVDTLVVEDLPDPTAGPGQVVVDVVAAAVNFPDVLLVADQYQIHIPVPFTPGSEYAGTVSSVGPGVGAVAVGDRVTGAAMSGAFAEQMLVPAAGLQTVAAAVDLRSAAAFGVAHRTSYLALRTVAAAGPGDWVVVLGAAGGVGLAAVELAKVLGARVIAAASSEEKLRICRARGADEAVNYQTENLKERIKEITGQGANVVIDPVGGRWAEEALRALRFGGRFVCVGFASGEIPRIPLNLVLLKGSVITGFTMLGLAQARPEEVARHEAELWDLLATGKVAPHIGASFPLEQGAQAMAELAERRATGKVLIEPGSRAR